MIREVVTFFLGIVASFLAWLVVSNIMKPRLEIDSKIYRFKSIDNIGSYVYKVKVTNRSKLFDVYDVNLSARAYIYGLDPDNPNECRSYIISVGDKNTPYISRAHGKDNFTSNERYFVIRTPYNENADKGKLRKLYNRYHKDCTLGTTMLLEKVFHIVEGQSNRAVIEFSITATSSFSASRICLTQPFCCGDIVEIDTFDPESHQDE